LRLGTLFQPGADAPAAQVGYNIALFPKRFRRVSPMLETNPIHNLIEDLSGRTDVLRGYL